MRVSIEVSGAEQAARRIEEVGRAVTAPLGPFFEILAADWEAAFMGRIDTSGGETPWPPMSATRARIRAGTQTPGAFPLLRETGDLRASIRTLAVSESELEVGTVLEYAALLQHGGVTAPRSMIPNATVPPRPFVYLTVENVDDAIEMLDAYLFEGGGQ